MKNNLIVFLFLLAILVGSVYARDTAEPNPEHPPIHKNVFTGNWGSGGKIPRQLFWKETELADHVDKARELNRESLRNGIKPVVGLMMWSSAYYHGKPGAGRKHSDDPGYNAYWRWNHARKHYFARRADGRIWSRSYTESGEPKDAWISPSRPLDSGDRGPAVRTYGEWYAERIAERARAIDARGVSLADHADMMPHSTALDQDFSASIVKEFERWSRLNIPGETPSEWARFIKEKHLTKWINYLADQYGEWWAEIAKRIERKTGGKGFYVLQKHVFPHAVRYGAADSVWMRKNVDRQDQILYHVENWSVPMDRGVGTGSISSYCAQLGTHLCREPDITRGAFVPVTDKNRYPGEGNYSGTDHFRAVDEAVDQFGRSLSDIEKTELQERIQRGAWMALGWTHLANRDGEVERAAMYWFTHRAKEKNPYALYEEVVQPIYPTRPYGPAFYYSRSIETDFEQRREKWDPLEKIGDQAKRQNADSGNFFPGYYVGDRILPRLQPYAYPTAWITDHVDALKEGEKEALESIAPVYDIDNFEEVPAVVTPVRFHGDVTGYAFVDQKDRVVLLATRDHIKNDRDIKAKVSLHELPDGTYTATDLVEDEQFTFEIKDGTGSFEFSLQRYTTRAFHTTLPADPD